MDNTSSTPSISDQLFDLWVSVGMLNCLRRRCKAEGKSTADADAVLSKVLVEIKALHRAR